MFIFGTRPEAIKLAPVIQALKESNSFTPIVVVTAQHRFLLDQVLALFSIKPDIDLDIIEERQTLSGLTAKALIGLTPVVESFRPDLIMVQGDTTSTFVGALAAFYSQIPVAHLEAGLRTHEPYRPFPEEMNRALTSRLATLHLAPTFASQQNLLKEGVPEQSIVITGNTVIDALLWAVKRELRGDDLLDELGIDSRQIILVTAHRRESWGREMAAIGRALVRLAESDPNILVVFPIHLNPVVRESFLPIVGECNNIRLIEPLSYVRFAHLMERADIVVTDSGGIQEEAPSLGKPVLVMRTSTERPEGVEAGTVRLVGTNSDEIVQAVRLLLESSEHYASMANSVNPYGDGKAASRTLAAIEHLFGLGPRPIEFGIARKGI